jgi:hypothetical protein
MGFDHKLGKLMLHIAMAVLLLYIATAIINRKTINKTIGQLLFFIIMGMITIHLVLFVKNNH